MGEQSQHSRSTNVNTIPDRRSDEVVGVVAVPTETDGSLDGIGRIQRAKAEGKDVLVALSSARSPELANVARAVGAEVVDLGTDIELEEEVVRDVLSVVAERRGYSQVVFPDEGLFGESDGATAPADVSVLERNSTSAESGEAIVAVPAYNEAGEIASVVEEAGPHADRVLVIDDGSADDTVDRAREAGATVVQHDYNRGYGAALKTAFDEAARLGADSLVTIDGDGQHDPADIPVLRGALEDRTADIVIGSRFADGATTDISPVRRFGVRTVNVLTNLSLGYVRPGRRITDTQSGFRAYSDRAVRSLSGDRSLETQMGASTDILYHARNCGYEIEEVATTITYDVENSSSQNPFTHGVTLVENITKTVMYQHPLLSLGLPGFVTVLFAIWFGFLLVLNYLEIGLVWTVMLLFAAACSWLGVVAALTAVLIIVFKLHRGSGG